ncbi:MAG: hypothetical protein PW792_14845 [Acidobacteriaceae bacterium]|nr:hypothetical protein [Acidobacteriaceae bacterium]
MQTLCRALLLLSALLAPGAALAEKIHTVALGAPRRVPYTPPEATPETKGEDATTLRIRPLVVDGKVKEWTVGEMHEVTDRTFVIRRALHLNDALPNEAARWTWQPGPWLTVDRTSGRVTALHLPDFDAQLSHVVWFRDYAAYCGLHVLVKSTSLTAIVVELGARRAAVSQKISAWPIDPLPHPACAATTWQRTPMRATFHPANHAEMTFSITGSTSLIEDDEE